MYYNTFHGGDKTYLAPPHIFELGGGGPIPSTPCSDAPMLRHY